MPGQTNYLFLIGAPKCGTSTIAAGLGALEGVCLAKGKEPRFFTGFADRSKYRWTGPASPGWLANLVGTEEGYEAEFSADPHARWRVDASTDYLWCPETPGLIAAFAARPDVGQVRLVAILRDPVARAISQYKHTRRDGFETRSLGEAVALEPERIAAGWVPLFAHVGRSRYADPIACYRAAFGDDLLVLDYHRMGDGLDMIAQIAAFAGIAAPAALVPPEVHNESFVPTSRAVESMLGAGPATRLARALVPKGLRAPIRKMIEGANRRPYRPTEAEIAMLRDALHDEIPACLDSPEIPTGNWHMALAGRGG